LEYLTRFLVSNISAPNYVEHERSLLHHTEKSFNILAFNYFSFTPLFRRQVMLKWPVI